MYNHEETKPEFAILGTRYETFYIFYKVTVVYSENKILSCWIKFIIIIHSKYFPNSDWLKAHAFALFSL